jgi:hypothetical protein
VANCRTLDICLSAGSLASRLLDGPPAYGHVRSSLAVCKPGASDGSMVRQSKRDLIVLRRSFLLTFTLARWSQREYDEKMRQVGADRRGERLLLLMISRLISWPGPEKPAANAIWTTSARVMRGAGIAGAGTGHTVRLWFLCAYLLSASAAAVVRERKDILFLICIRIPAVAHMAGTVDLCHSGLPEAQESQRILPQDVACKKELCSSCRCAA